jgi:hypothetical protein
VLTRGAPIEKAINKYTFLITKKTTAVFKEDRTTDEETERENIRGERGTSWIGSIDHRKSRPEKTRRLRNMVAEEDAED